MSRKKGAKAALFAIVCLSAGLCVSTSAGGADAKGGMHTAFRLRSEAFLSGGSIPRRHTGEGDDISPSLRWENLPANTAELALVVDDPDAPTPEPWVHWVIYKIPPDEPGIAENVPLVSKLDEPYHTLQGKNSWGSVGYRGPLPPKGHGTHHYRFILYALDQELTLAPELEKAALLKAMAGHVLANAELVGVYER